jgi:hypothetical protein
MNFANFMSKISYSSFLLISPLLICCIINASTARKEGKL